MLEAKEDVFIRWHEFYAVHIHDCGGRFLRVRHHYFPIDILAVEPVNKNDPDDADNQSYE
jgi:hypothetical protein